MATTKKGQVQILYAIVVIMIIFLIIAILQRPELTDRIMAFLRLR